MHDWKIVQKPARIDVGEMKDLAIAHHGDRSVGA
jgi:hypothetical protein